MMLTKLSVYGHISIFFSENCIVVFRLLESHWKQEELTFLREQFWKVYVHVLDIFALKET